MPLALAKSLLLLIFSIYIVKKRFVHSLALIFLQAKCVFANIKESSCGYLKLQWQTDESLGCTFVKSSKHFTQEILINRLER